MTNIKYPYLAMCFLILTCLADPAAGQATRTVDQSNFKKWLEFIQPAKSELQYEKIGWRGAFWPAVQEAKKLGRPILLWTMNGHPLGCT